MKRLAVFTAALCLPMTAVAVETSFDGFLTVGAGYISEDGVSYAGYEGGEWSFEPDTVTGLQFGVQFNDRFSATSQIIVRGEDDWEPEIEWAYLSFAAKDNLTLRAGRLRPPVFAISDYVDVGYAYPWARPVEEVYFNVPFTHYEGADFVWRPSFGAWDMTIQGYFGSAEHDFGYRGSDVDITLEDLMGIAFTFDRDNWSLRASHHRSDVTFDAHSVRPLLAGLRMTPFAAVADDIGSENEPVSFTEVAATYDAETWFFRAEATTTEFERGLLADQFSWYTTVGKHFEAYTPYVTFSAVDAQPETGYSDPIPRGFDPMLDFLAMSVDAAAASGRNDWHVTTVGTRWNVFDTTAIKGEFSKVQKKSGDGVDFHAFSIVVNVLF